MNIVLIEPFFTGSHKQWALGYKKYSKYNVEILSLKGIFWKWRMHGGALTLSKMFNEYLKKSISTRHIELKAIKSHGLWDGLKPFKNQEIKKKINNHSIAVITRATLNWKMLIQFWKSVPKISKAIKNARGVSFFKGIGELPFIQQATISIWKNNDYINDFAYKNIDHTSVIKKTRKNKWYKEDLFSRFLVISDLSNKFSK